MFLHVPQQEHAQSWHSVVCPDAQYDSIGLTAVVDETHEAAMSGGVNTCLELRRGPQPGKMLRVSQMVRVPTLRAGQKRLGRYKLSSVLPAVAASYQFRAGKNAVANA
jgi:hypothetical protein